MLPHGRTINEQYYRNLLWNDVHQEIHKKRLGKLLMKTILLHDSVCPHTATFITIGWEIINNPPYSPDLW
jgi:hypothetical protein